MNKIKGFTIVELIVVIILLAILAAFSGQYFFSLPKKANVSVMLADLNKVRFYEELHQHKNQVYTETEADLEELGFKASGENTITLTLSLSGFIAQIENMSAGTICVSSTGDADPDDLPLDPPTVPGETKCN